MIHLINYLALTMLFLIISFFIGIFIHYLRTKSVVPRKMLTFKKGGMFEHYRIVLPIVLVVAILHVSLGLDPFLDNWLAFIIRNVTFGIVTFIFLVFVFIFMFYFITFLYIKIFKIKDRREFYNAHTHKMIMTAFILAAIVIVSAVLTFIITAPAVGNS